MIGAEKLTRITDFDDKKTGMLFGDGAGAVVLGPRDGGAGIGPIDLGADGGLGDTIVATPEDPCIRMDGISTFKIAVKRLVGGDGLRRRAPPASSSTTSTCSSTTRPTARILKAVGERLDLEPAKVADYIAQLGNTSAASIPLTLLALAARTGACAPGTRCSSAAIGAGFTWGAGVLEWTGS